MIKTVIMGRFKEFIDSIFLNAEVKAVEEIVDEVVEPTLEEVKAAVEEVAEVLVEEVKQEYILKEDVEGLIEDVVSKTLEVINMNKEASEKLGNDLREENKSLRLSIEAIQLELNKPAGDAAVVVPEVKKAAAQKAFNMQKEVEKGL